MSQPKGRKGKGNEDDPTAGGHKKTATANSMDPDDPAHPHSLIWIHAGQKRTGYVFSWREIIKDQNTNRQYLTAFKESAVPTTFTKRLEDKICNENETLKLKCQLNKPDVTVKWLKNGKHVNEGGRFKVLRDQCNHKLVIDDVCKDDKGYYQCVNEGDVKSRCTVTVKELQASFTKQLKDKTLKENETLKLKCQLNKPDASVKWSKDDQDIVEGGRFKVLRDQCHHKLVIDDVCKDDEGDYQCVSEGDVKSRCTVTVIELQASFTKQLEDKTLKENETLKLKCQLNKPDASVKWSKGGQDIVEGGRFKVLRDQCNHKLVIDDVCKDDKGDYQCVNEGDVKSRCTVTVKELQASFTKQLEDKTLKENETLKLKCQLNKPDASVKWSKDGQDIVEGGRFKVLRDQCHHKLVIDDVCKDDEGDYQCVSEGDVKSRCTVTVIELSATFTKWLEDKTLTKNETLKLNCQLNKPSVAVKWLKDGQDIKGDVRFKVSSDQCHGSHQLVIDDVSKENEGEYECVYEGDVRSRCTVTVKELQASFTKQLEDKTLKENETLKLKCQLNKPDASVKWSKDGQDIVEGGRFKVLRDQCHHKLVIHDVCKDDKGDYQCVSEGDVKSRCTVTVKDSLKAASNRFTSPVFIVICNVLITYAMLYCLVDKSSNIQTPDETETATLVKRMDGVDRDFSLMKQQHEAKISNYSEMLLKYKIDKQSEDEIKFESMTGKIAEITTNVSDKADITYLNDTFSKLEEKLNKAEKHFTEKVKQMESSFTEKMSEFMQFIKEFEEEFGATRESLRVFEEKTDRKMKYVETSLSSIEERVERKLENVNKDVDMQLSGIIEAKKKADEILENIKGDVDRILPNTFNKEALTTAFLVLIVFVFLLAFWIYRVQTRLAASGSGHYQSMNAAEVLQQIPTRVSLSNSVCIVSFDEARRTAHEALVTSAFLNVRDVKMEYFVVRRHEHLLRLPKCKLYIMCTEFSERHVIIEERGLGLGDLKRCTYETIQRYGAKMIILYTRDPGSRSLGDQLYNNRINCVSAQPELSGLRDLGRFFSTYDELTDLQKRSLNDTIAKSLQ